MKTLLIRLKSIGFPVPPPDAPLGLMYVAAALEAAGHEVVVRDLNWQEIESALWDEIRRGEIGAVGVSMLSYVRSQGYQLVLKINETNSNVKIMVGGIHATALGERIIERYPVDACIVGEGEETIVELVNRWVAHESADGVSGAWIPGAEFTSRPLIKNLDSVSFPAWRHTDLSKFTMTCTTSFKPGKIANGIQIDSVPWAPIIASRGCVGRCIFCNAWKHWDGIVRFRSAENIISEIEMLYDKYGVRLIAFNDDAFPLRRSQMVDFCNGLLKRNVKIAWQTTTRADAVDSELCELMAASGCFMVAVGIESGSPAIHARLNKRLDLEKAIVGMEAIYKSGMALYPLLMIGNPGETRETISETIQYLNRVKPYFYSYVTGVMVVPGTELCAMSGINNDFWLDENADGLPLYLKENSREQLREYSEMIESGVPRWQ